MKTLVKIMLATAPVLALIFLYVLSQQQHLDTQMRKQDAQFERDWNEFANELSDLPRYRDRANEAEARLAELRQKEAKEMEQLGQFREDLASSIEALDEKGKEETSDDKENQ